MEKDKTINAEILDSIGEGLFTVDKNFKINFFNRAAEKITGHSKEEVLGKFCKHVFQSELCFSKCPIGIVLESHKNIYDFESKINHKNGSRTPIKLNAAVLRNSDDEPVGGVISFRDVSDLEAIKNELSGNSNFYGIIAHSKPMQEIFNLINEISDSDAPVLIQGESGTGKEMIADAIKLTSLRKDKPFVKINISVLPDNLLASELFGHARGSFTDAVKDRIGRFEIADTGTIFLDEIGEMPLSTQVKLLRVLQEGTFERIGESNTRNTDVRVIAATNTVLSHSLRDGKMREDLFYRLNVIPINVPPLRNRKEDIPYLVHFFINKYSRLYKKNITDISEDALDQLMNYNFPGNVRELENIIEYSLVRTKENIITASKLPVQLMNVNAVVTNTSQKIFRQNESTELVRLLEQHRWNKTKVAEEMGIGRTTLWRKIKSLDLDSK